MFVFTGSPTDDPSNVIVTGSPAVKPSPLTVRLVSVVPCVGVRLTRDGTTVTAFFNSTLAPLLTPTALIV